MHWRVLQKPEDIFKDRAKPGGSKVQLADTGCWLRMLSLLLKDVPRCFPYYRLVCQI